MNIIENTTKQDIEATTGHVIPAKGKLDNLDDATLAILINQPFIAREIRSGHLVVGEAKEFAEKPAKGKKADTTADAK